jgi:hypothetical protein
MDHEVHQGDDFTFEIAYYEDDDTTPIDVSGWSFYFTVKPAVDEDDTDAEAYIAADPADFTIDEDVTGSGTDNRASFAVADTVIQAIPVGTHVADFLAVDDAGRKQTQGYGDFRILPQVTRRA